MDPRRLPLKLANRARVEETQLFKPARRWPSNQDVRSEREERKATSLWIRSWGGRRITAEAPQCLLRNW
eukprot:scaffold2144_cov215-Pinguiococcus_pyrenoidosus.AAC.11